MKHHPAKAHRLRRFLLYAVTAVVVTAAVLLSLARLFIADVKTYRYDVEQIASAFLGHPVRIDSMDARFEGLTPTLVFRGVRMLDKRGRRELAGFREARLGIAVWDSILSERVVPARFVIEGIDLVITRQKDGSIQVQGIDLDTLRPRRVAPEAGAELAEWLFRRSKLAIRHSSIVWQDYKRGGARRHFRNVDLQMLNAGNRHHIRAEVSLPKLLGHRFAFALSVTGDMRLPSTWVGRMYLEGNGINLPEWGDFLQLETVNLRRGLADARVWSVFDRGRLRHLSGELTLAGLLMEGEFLREPLVVDLVGGFFDWQDRSKGWDLAVDQLRFISGQSVWPASRVGMRQRRNGERGELRVTAEYLRLEDVADLLRKTRFLPDAVQDWAKTAQPAGDVRNLALKLDWPDWQPGDAIEVQARLDQFAMAPAGRIPGIAGFSGRFWSDAQHGELALESRQMLLNLPHLFRTPLKFTRAEGRVRWRRFGKALWQVGADRLLLDTPDIHTRNRFLLQFEPGNRPWLELVGRFAEGDGSQVSTYLPVGIMKPGLVRWLDSAIRAGHVTGGGVVVRGRLARFRDLVRDGQFRVDFEATDVELAYAQGWPALRQGQASARFTGEGIAVDLQAARLYDSRIGPARIRIPRYHNPELKVEGRLEGPFADVVRFMAESPLGAEATPVLKAMRIGGRYRGELGLDLPLKREAMKRDASWQGRLDLQDVSLHMYDGRLDVSDIRGTVRFDRQGETGRDLRGRLFGNPAVFDVFSRPLDGGLQTSIVARSELDSADLLRRLGLRPAGRVSGRSQWQGVFVFGRDGDGRPLVPSLQAASDLAGVKLDLPSPLAKPAETKRPLTLEARFLEGQRQDVTWRLDPVACGAMRFGPDGVQRAAVHFGSPREVRVPDGPRIELTGRLTAVRIGQWSRAWRDMVPAGRSGAEPLPWRLGLDELAVLEPETDADGNGEALDPADIPPVEGTVGRLQFGNTPLGLVAVRTRPVRRGMQIDWLDVNGDHLQAHLAGEWKRTLLGDRSRIEVSVSSANFGKALVALRAPRVIDDGILHLTGNLNWPGPLYAPKPENLQGKLQLKLSNGSFTGIDPGPARLLGLLNLSAIPRLLMGGSREGFNFDEVDGRFELGRGRMRIPELVIRGPLAQIEMRGEVELETRRVDQEVVVIPNVGGTLPVATGLAFGLEVGALIALLDQLVGNQLNKAGARTYHVTGTLEKPQVTLIRQPEEEEVVDEGD